MCKCTYREYIVLYSLSFSPVYWTTCSVRFIRLRCYTCCLSPISQLMARNFVSKIGVFFLKYFEKQNSITNFVDVVDNLMTNNRL